MKHLLREIHLSNFILTHADTSMLSSLCQDDNGIFQCLENIFCLTPMLGYSALCRQMAWNASDFINHFILSIKVMSCVCPLLSYHTIIMCHSLSAGILHGCRSNQYQLGDYFARLLDVTSQMFPWLLLKPQILNVPILRLLIITVFFTTTSLSNRYK